MELLNNKKRAYLGYFLSVIRVDLYNKILLRTILDSNFSYNYDNLNLENNLKAELQKKEKKHYFYIYFQIRLEFYNKFFEPINYTVEEVIDLIYEYRNFLLDDYSRIRDEKFPLILNKSLEEKQKEINIIILLLLSENMLEDYAEYSKQQDKLAKFQNYFYCQDKDVITYRKYVNKYFGLSNYNNKIVFLERQLSGFDISYPKKYSLIIYLFNGLPFLEDNTREILTKIDMSLTKDYISNNNGLLKIEYNSKNIFLNFNQLFIIYLLIKHREEDLFERILSHLINNQKTSNTNIIALTKNLYNFDKEYFEKLIHLKVNKQVTYKYYNFKLRKLTKPLPSPIILRMFLNSELYHNHFKVDPYRFSTKNLESNMLSLELISYALVKNNLNYSIKLYLKSEFSEAKNLKEGLYSILNQIKFTTNIRDFHKLESIDEKTIYELQKDYKSNKKTIVRAYINTMHILLILRVHKYYQSNKYENVYIYRNKIMHFQKDLIHKEIDKLKILQEIDKLKKIHWNTNIDIQFSHQFFYLLEIKNQEYYKLIED